MIGLIKYEAAIDYIRVTLPARASDHEAIAFASEARLALGIGGGQDEGKKARYLGYYGEERGGVFYGARHDGWMVQASGHAADAVARLKMAKTARCTRLDLALTIWFSERQEKIASIVAQEAKTARETGLAHASTKIQLIDGFGDGDTVYIGSRTSEQFARVYDKERESGKAYYVNAWRFEIEYKGDRATPLWTALRTDGYRSDQIGETVVSWFRERGISYPPGVSIIPGVPPQRVRDETEDTRLLAWLATSVKPTVRRLFDKNLGQAVYFALGLGDDEQKSTDNFS